MPVFVCFWQCLLVASIGKVVLTCYLYVLEYQDPCTTSEQVFELSTLLSDLHLTVLVVANPWPSLFEHPSSLT